MNSTGRRSRRLRRLKDREGSLDADGVYGQLSPEDRYLSYHDICLTREDVDTLRYDWLTDNIISFWQEYLEHEFLTAYIHSNIVLLRPTMAVMLMMTPDPMTIKEDLPDFTNTTHIFLPINDSNKPEIAESGSHWSLLLISVIDGVAYHYDSLRQGNETKAGFATGQMSVLLGKRLRFTPLEDSPLQENMSDCGVFVCLNMRHLLLRRLLMCRSDEQVNVSMAGRRVDAKEGRLEIARIIEDFRREGERRRSRSASPYRKAKSRSPPRID